MLIELRGDSAGAGVSGLSVSAGGVTIRGLVINLFSQHGIYAYGSSGGMLITGNFIGTDSSGTAALGNGIYGIYLGSVGGGSSTVGGAIPAERNLVSGNSNAGIDLAAWAPVSVLGNYIGTNAAGTAAIGNAGGGIAVMSSGHKIGGRTAGERNVISGNSFEGIYIASWITPGTTQDVVIEGNYIGLDYSGTSAIPNSNSGIYLSGGGVNITNNRIGGTISGSGNVIAGNSGAGITMFSQDLGPTHGSISGNRIQGNIIGMNAHGAFLPNGWPGIFISSAQSTSTVTQNIIGGVEDGANIIASNTTNGIKMAGDTNTRNSILFNSIFSNGQIGIDLGPAGVTGNDVGDGDSGPNNLQNYPVITTAETACGYTRVRGTLNSTASTQFVIQFFAGVSCDPLGNGEGQTYLGQTRVTTDISGNASFFAVVPSKSAGDVITATATDSLGNTSEFSACVTAGPGNEYLVNYTGDTVDASIGDGICADAGAVCSLRAAVQEANAQNIFSCISLPEGFVALTIAGADEDAAATGDFDICKDMVIRGTGKNLTQISTAISDRIFHIDPALTGIAAAFENLWVYNGAITAPGGAGGNIANNGNLYVEKCRFNNGIATFGGGIYNQGNITLINTEFINNHGAYGGAIYTKFGRCILQRSSLWGNVASVAGGGINSYDFGSLEISNSTISYNIAWDPANPTGNLPGGGINAEAGSVTIRNSTIAYNMGSGGGVGGINILTATGSVMNSIVAMNTGGDCAGSPFTSLGHNISSDGTCSFSSAGDVPATDPMLGPIVNNGGFNATRALLIGSPAIDAGSEVDAPAIDQRGVARTYGTTIDIGAFEYLPAGAAPVRIAGTTPVYYPTIQFGYDAAVDGDTIEAQAVTFNETLSFGCGVSVRLQGGFDSGFSAQGSVSTVAGSVVISSGALTVGNIEIR